VVVAVLIGVVCAPVRPALSATLPQDVRQTTNAMAAEKPIKAFVDQQVQKLKSDDPLAQAAARDALVAEAQGPAGGGNIGAGAAAGAGAAGAGAAPAGPSAAFLDKYTEVLNTALNEPAKHKDPRVRLNTAIVVARVAKEASKDTNNARLAPIVTEMLADESEAVVLWAVKASKFLIPAILSNAVSRQNNTLLPAFMKAVQKQIKSGPIVQSAFESLRVEPSAVGQANWNAVVPLIVDPIHQLLAIRIDEYKKGIPPLAYSESTVTAFLCLRTVWNAQTKAQQKRTVQEISNLIGVASQRFGTATSIQRAELADLINKAMAACWVIGDTIGNEEMKKEARTDLGPTTPPAEVVKRVQGMPDAIRSNQQFADLKAPPALESVPPTTTATSTAAN
jgi:hypothetical protein